MSEYLEQLDGYDWAEVFGEGSGGNCTTIIPDVPPGDETTSTAEFHRRDVAEIKGQQDGEYDGPDWIVWGRLKDGRYFVARGGCDYTGWDCQASNGGSVASTEKELIQFGMTENERSRFGVELPIPARVLPPFDSEESQ